MGITRHPLITRRTFFGTATGLATTGLAAGCTLPGGRAERAARGARSFALTGGGANAVRLTVPALAHDLRLFVIGDTHFAFHDARDAAYADFYKRMAQWPAPREPFEKMLAKARAERPDLLLLVGDNLSFPTLANVDYLAAQLSASGLDWYYVAGNHDWHFEGVPGSDEAQRAEWAPKRLAPLYRGRDPFMSSRVVKGVRFVAIDNSIYHVSEAQLAFWKAEAAKGDPTVLFMHIPLWLPGWGLFTCGNPDWGAARDPYATIERRETWAPRQSPSTFAFRDAVLGTPNLVGVFTGHEHRLMVGTERGKFLFSVPSNRNGAFLDVSLARAWGGPLNLCSDRP